jgi:hypothetical protein
MMIAERKGTYIRFVCYIFFFYAYIIVGGYCIVIVAAVAVAGFFLVNTKSTTFSPSTLVLSHLILVSCNHDLCSCFVTQSERKRPPKAVGVSNRQMR